MAITPEQQAQIDAAAQITSEPVTTTATPASITTETQPSTGAPVIIAPESNGGIVSPSSIVPESGSDVSAPSNITPKSGGAVATPVNVGAIPSSATSTPSSIAPLAPSALNRALTPLFKFNASMGLPDSVTYSRSSSASYIETYADRFGRYAKRLTNDYVGSVTNLVTYSEQFDNAAWATTGISKIKTNTSQGVEYKLIESDSIGEHRLDQTGVLSTTDVNTYTVRAKYFKNRGIFLRQGNSFGAFFDLFNGVILSQSASIEASIKYVSNGFYDCSITLLNPSNDIVRLNLLQGTLTYNYTGDNESGVIIKLAQATISDKPLPYVKTLDTSESQTFTANPRYEEKGLLVEGASTNLILQSEGFETVTWSKSNSTVIGNSSLAPDGSFSSDKLIVNNGLALGAGSVLQAITKSALETTYTASVFVKAQEFNSVILYVHGATTNTRCVVTYNISNDSFSGLSGIGDFTAVSSKSEKFANGWYKISLTLITNTDTTVTFKIYPSDSVSSTGNGTSGILLWGAQLEEKPFATSYIRTTTAAVSRSAENISLENPNLPDSYRNMTALSEFSAFGASTLASQAVWVYRKYSTILFYANVGFASNQPSIYYGNSRQAFSVVQTPLDSETFVSVYNDSRQIVNYVNGLFNGFAVMENVTQTAETALILGATLGGNHLFGHIKRLEFYDLALTANEVKAL